MIKTLDDLSAVKKSTEMGPFGWVSSIHDVQIWKVTAPAKDHLTHWNPQKLLCTVCLQVAVVIAQNFGVHKYFM